MNYIFMLLNKFNIGFLISFTKSPVLCGALFVFSTHLSSSTIFSYHSSAKEHSHYTYFPNPIKKIFFKQKNNQLAAVLAFPLPFGCVGLHRVYLGTAAHVPIVYAATAGGVFGLIPLMDCIMLLSKKDVTLYENNSHVIMWINHPATE
ncbi:MAG: hypothetical protein N2203_08455 [Bacteroidia bacterium]|nr:hypothetical protein [Bacteroidia bacterium]